MLKNSLLAAVLKPNIEVNLLSQTSLAILRAILGIMIIHNGLDKLSNIESFSQAYVEVIGLPFPIFFSYVAALTDFSSLTVRVSFPLMPYWSTGWMQVRCLHEQSS